MTELWIQKSTTDVHRLIDNKLPEGSVCTGVTMMALDEGAAEEYVAIINGKEVIVEAPAEESASDVADAIVAQAPPPPEPQPPWLPTGAQVEGAEAPIDEPMFGQAEEQYEYDDSDEDDEDEVSESDAPPKPKKAKTKKKK